MSIKHENLVWDVDMPALKKFTLITLYREADFNTGERRMSVQKLAALCGMSESAVRKFVGELEREGYIAQMKVRGHGVHYRLTFDGQVTA
jgi:biotin operon repressor